VKKIKLSNSHLMAFVDDDKFEELNKYKWCLNSNGYIIRSKIKSDPENYPKTIYMHRQIMNVIINSKYICIDHINHIICDNTACNLRKCNKAENSRNKNLCVVKNTNSKFKGVKYNVGSKKWFGRIKFENKMIHIGSFETDIEAALAYDQMARYLYKDFSSPNFKNKNEKIIDVEKVLHKKEFMSSKYHGVYWNKSNKNWGAGIRINNKGKYLGSFSSEIEAAKCVDNFIIENKLDRKLNFERKNL